MRVHTYLSRSCFLVLVAASLGTLAGCGSNQSLGGGEPSDAAVASGGAGGTTGVTTVTGGTTASITAAGGATVAGTSAGGVSSSAGMTANAGRTSTASTSTGGATVAGGTTAVAGKTATGGSSTEGTTATGGSTVIAGKTATGGASTGGTTATGGSIGTGGSAAGGTSATGGTGAGGSTGGAVGGVSLVAELYVTELSNVTDCWIKPSWQNGSSMSIFLYGCGTVDVYKKDASGWKNLGKTIACAWEGISPEVKAGTTYTDDSPAYGPVYKTWGTGTYRVAGTYGVGCTDPSAGQSKAGCTAFYVATSNEITVTAPPPSADAGVDGACGTLPEGVTCKKPTGGCAAMTCVSASWTCAPGQTPAAVVPGVCDTIAPDAGTGG